MSALIFRAFCLRIKSMENFLYRRRPHFHKLHAIWKKDFIQIPSKLSLIWLNAYYHACKKQRGSMGDFGDIFIGTGRSSLMSQILFKRFCLLGIVRNPLRRCVWCCFISSQKVHLSTFDSFDSLKNVWKWHLDSEWKCLLWCVCTTCIFEHPASGPGR